MANSFFFFFNTVYSAHSEIHKIPINCYLVNLSAFYCVQEAYEHDTRRFIPGIVHDDAYLGNVADEPSN